jgi:hypothetical protein
VRTVRSDNDSGVTTTFELIEHLGDVQLAYYLLPGSEDNWSVKLSATEKHPEVGSMATLWLPPTQCYLFDANGCALKP